MGQYSIGANTKVQKAIKEGQNRAQASVASGFLEVVQEFGIVVRGGLHQFRHILNDALQSKHPTRSSELHQEICGGLEGPKASERSKRVREFPWLAVDVTRTL